MNIFAIAAVAAGLWFVGHETVKGVKKVDHAVSCKVFHKGCPAPKK